MGQNTRMLRQALRPEAERGERPGQSAQRLPAPASDAHILICVLLGTAFVIRLDGITRPSVESRDLHNALIARQLFYGDGAASQRGSRTCCKSWARSSPRSSPPCSISSPWRGSGSQAARSCGSLSSFSSALWILGGVFFYLIAGRLTTRPGALVAVGLYLFWPRVHQSPVHPGRHDAHAAPCGRPGGHQILGAAVFRKAPRCGVVSGAATFAKPGVAILFLLALCVALAVSRRALTEAVRHGRLPLFTVLAALPTAVYYVYGTYLRDFLSGQAGGPVDPSLVGTQWFWRGWEMARSCSHFRSRGRSLRSHPWPPGSPAF
jgi:hypothetical protein